MPFSLGPLEKDFFRVLCHMTVWRGQKLDKENLLFMNLWWRQALETLFALLALYEGNPPVPDGSPNTHPIMFSFDVSICNSLNKLLKKLLSCWWVETPSCSRDLTQTRIRYQVYGHIHCNEQITSTRLDNAYIREWTRTSLALKLGNGLSIIRHQAIIWTNDDFDVNSQLDR